MSDTVKTSHRNSGISFLKLSITTALTSPCRALLDNFSAMNSKKYRDFRKFTFVNCWKKTYAFARW